MKVNFRLFAALAVFAVVCSCDVPENGQGNGGEGEGNSGGSVSVLEGKKISRIRNSYEDKSSEMLGYEPSESTPDILGFTYGPDGRLASVLHEVDLNGKIRRSYYTFDYSVKGELHIVRNRPAEEWGEGWDPGYAHLKYLLDGQNRISELYASKTSALLNDYEYRYAMTFEYLSGSRLGALVFREDGEELGYRFNYVDGSLMSVDEYENDVVDTDYLTWPSDAYVHRYPAKGQFAAIPYSIVLFDGEIDDCPIMLPALAGYLGDMGDFLMEKSEDLSRKATDNIAGGGPGHERPGEFLGHESFREKRSTGEPLSYEYEFDGDGYVIKMECKKAFEIYQIEYDIFSGTEYDENIGGYPIVVRNCTETRINSGFNSSIYEIDYLK